MGCDLAWFSGGRAGEPGEPTMPPRVHPAPPSLSRGHARSVPCAEPRLPNLPLPHVSWAWRGLNMQGGKLHAERTECSQRLIQGGKKRNADCTFFFLLVQRRVLFPPPPLHIPDLSLPLPAFFPSFLLVQVLGFFSLAWLWPKAQKRRFRKRPGRAQGPFVCFGTGAGNLAGPESRRLLQGNVSVLLSPSPAARPAAAFHGGDAGRAGPGPSRVPAPAPPQKEGRGAEKERVLPPDRTG